MLSVDENGSKTIPSVVSFIPTSLDTPQSSKKELSLPPWTTSTTSTTSQSLNNLQWPSSYTIQTGKAAIQYEVKYPKSTYRNVKRVIGTGGTMANLATGVVPNLYVDSVNGHTDSGMSVVSSGMSSSGMNGGKGELDMLFNMLEDSDKLSKKKKYKKKKKKKQKNKWKKRKENELPKLHKQLVDAKDDPALLSCSMMSSGEGSSVDIDSGVVDSSEGECVRCCGS